MKCRLFRCELLWFTLLITYEYYFFFRLINEDMQRRIEALKLEANNKDDVSSKASKIEDECVSIYVKCLYFAYSLPDLGCFILQFTCLRIKRASNDGYLEICIGKYFEMNE